MTINIAIDGPSGAGKGTVAKELSHKLGYGYLDTGAMYRAVTLYCMEEGIDLSSAEKVASILPEIKIDYVDGSLFLNGRNVDVEIRTLAVTKNVSLISSYSSVRNYLVEQQRNIARSKDVILDGRDIGTVVLPDATHKIFLTATPEIRAKRRYLQSFKNTKTTYEEVLADINRRDAFDSSREISPLVAASDAVVLDNGEMTVDETVQAIIDIIEEN